MSSQVPDPGTPIKQCKIVQLYEYEDSCQANKWLRCSICGAHEGGNCELSDDTVAYRYLSATQQEEDRVRKINEALEFGRQYAREMVRVERVKQAGYVEPVETKVPDWLRTWRFASSVITLLVISQWAISIFE